MTTRCSSTATAMMKFTGQGILKSRVSSAQQSLQDIRFGSGGGVGDDPADHNLGGFYTRKSLYFYTNLYFKTAEQMGTEIK
ncbi:MAG: hypothetical protein KJ638_08985 [Chloroflexi bacterium]|nr:hypothetical protein [Chloroflexota bacterium]